MSLSSASDPYPPATGSPPAALDDTSSRGRPDGTGLHDRSRNVGCAGEGGLSGDGTADDAQDETQDGATNDAWDGTWDSTTDDARDDARDSSPDETGDGDSAADKTLSEARDRAEPDDANIECDVDRPRVDVK